MRIYKTESIKKICGFIALALGLLCVAVGSVQEKPSGAALLKEATRMESVLYDVVAVPLSQDEVDRFLGHADAVLSWAEANADLWLSADEAEAPLAVVRGFAVWQETGAKSHEFLATLAKLMFVGEFNETSIDVGSMKKELAEMEAFLESPELPEGARPQVLEMTTQLSKLLEIATTSLPISYPIYTANKEKVDPVLSRLQRLGE